MMRCDQSPGEEWKSADGFGVGWLIVTCCVFVQLTFEAIGLVNACSHSERGFNSVEWGGLNVGLASDPPAADWALSVMAIPIYVVRQPRNRPHRIKA